MRLGQVHDSPRISWLVRAELDSSSASLVGGILACTATVTAALAWGCVKAPWASARDRQAYLAHFQASIRNNPGEIAVLLKDSGDTQVGKSLLQVVGTSNGEPGQGHVYNPGKWEVTKVSNKVLLFSRAGPRIDSD